MTHSIRTFTILPKLWFCCVLFLAFLTVPAFSLAETPAEYENAKVELSRLKADEKRAYYRHSWFKIADDFFAVYENNPSWNNRAAALFRSAEALDEMARRSRLSKDAEDAARRYEDLAKKYPSHVLADDALFRAAAVRFDVARETRLAKTGMEKVIKSYPNGDQASSAKEYLAKMGESTVASAGKTPTPVGGAKASLVPEISENSITKITTEVKKNVIRIVIRMDGVPAWRVEHAAADAKNGQSAKIIVSLQDTKATADVPAGQRYKNSPPLTRYAIDYTAAKKSTRIVFDFSKLTRYTVKVEAEPARVIIEATSSQNTLSHGIAVGAAKPAASSASPKTMPPTDLAAQLGLEVRTIVIDPGHGGKDPGTTGNGLKEKDITLDVAKRLGKELTRLGYSVHYTRDKDVALSLSERTKFAREKKADLFISVHVNSSGKKDVSGMEVYYLDLANSKDATRVAALENAVERRGLGEMEQILTDFLVGARTQESKHLAGTVLEKTVAACKSKDITLKNGGSKGAPFHVLVGSSMPSILVEVGYLSNATEAKKLGRDDFRDALAQGIGQGVQAYSKSLLSAGK